MCVESRCMPCMQHALRQTVDLTCDMSMGDQEHKNTSFWPPFFLIFFVTKCHPRAHPGINLNYYHRRLRKKGNVGTTRHNCLPIMASEKKSVLIIEMNSIKILFITLQIREREGHVLTFRSKMSSVRQNRGGFQ